MPNADATIVIDPGHGGTAPVGGSSPNNTSGGGLVEKDLTLSVARQVRDRLAGRARVLLTRDSDTNLSLTDRAGFAKAVAADVFVSLHCNAHPDPSHDATEVYVHRDPDPATRAFAQSLSSRVQQAAGTSSGTVIDADLGVLLAGRHAPGTRAALVEMFDLTHPARAAAAHDPAYLNAVASAIAEAAVAAASPDGAVNGTPSDGAAPATGTTGNAYAHTAGIITPDIDWSVTDFASAARIWADWLARYAQWSLGVPDHALHVFPHAAICQLKVSNGTASGYGTGFYIGDEVILTCGHNMLHPTLGEMTQVQVQPAYSPRMSVAPDATLAITGSSLVHPRWRSSFDVGHDLAVLRVPGLPAMAGHFDLANVSLGPDAGIVVCGYGKVDGVPYDQQGQRMDGSHVTDADADTIGYDIQTVAGNSGSPVFHDTMVIGVHTRADDAHHNRGVLLTPDKNDWIASMAGVGATSWSQGQPFARPLVDHTSSQADQSAAVLQHVGRSVAAAETGAQGYDALHDDSGRVNFGIGSWTGTRIADLLDAYVTYAQQQGLTAQLYAHLGGQASYTALTGRFRTQGVNTTLSPAEEAALRALGADAVLQPAQDQQLAADVKGDLDAIGSQGNPWYPFIDGGTGAISELAAHVLVHARHQSGGAGLRARLTEAINHFGGEQALGQAIVAGTVTERDFLQQLADLVVAHVQPQYQQGVRNRYSRLFTQFAGSDLAYYFDPS